MAEEGDTAAVGNVEEPLDLIRCQQSRLATFWETAYPL
jgi:hypothetical protein